LADALGNAGVEIYYTEEPDPTRHYAVNASDLVVDSPEDVVIAHFTNFNTQDFDVPWYPKPIMEVWGGLSLFLPVTRSNWSSTPTTGQFERTCIVAVIMVP